MLGRYVGGTLLVLGVAMLLAPSASEQDSADDAASATAVQPSDPVANERVAQASAVAPVSVPAPLRAAAIDPAPQAATRAQTAPAGVDARATGRAGETLAAYTQPNGAAPREPQLAPAERESLADLLPEGLLEDPAVPSLENPESLVAAPITAQTLALIERAEGRSTAAPASVGASVGVTELYVTGNRVNVRSGPSTGYEVIGSVRYGDAVELLDYASESWAEVRLPDARIGFMARSFLAAQLGDG